MLKTFCISIIIYCIFIGQTSHVYAYDGELASLLQTSPNIEATEQILILNNNLSHSISYLENILSDLDNSTIMYGKNKLKTTIRKAHIHYLKAFAYIFHDSMLSNRKKNKLAISEIGIATMMIKEIIIQTPDYSDIYRLYAVSLWLYGKAGILGLKKLITNNALALNFAKKAMYLNKDNIMAKASLAMFHASAPPWMGANTSEGKKIISVSMPDNIPKAHIFEFYVSRYYIYNKLRNNAKKKESINMLKSLYNDSWRIDLIQDK